MARTSRLLAPVLVMALLFSAFAVLLPPQNVSAAGETLSVGNVTLQGSTTQTVQVRIENVTDLGSAQVQLHFDPAIIDVVSVAAGNLPGGIYTGPVQYADYVSCSWLRATPGASGSFTFFSVTFKAISENSDSFDFQDWDGSNTGGGAFTPSFSKGTYEVLASTTVWVDDDWCGSDDGASVGDGYVFGYNAFCDIQDGVDAVSGTTTTVNVRPGDYSSFNITENGVHVLGQTLAEVDGGCNIKMQGVATDIVVDNLVFTGTVSCKCEGTNNVILRNLKIDGAPEKGIKVDTTLHPNKTVNIVNPVIHNCHTGIYVANDSVVVTNPIIEDCVQGIHVDTGGSAEVTGGRIFGSYNYSTGIWVEDGTLKVSGTEIYGHSYGLAGAPGEYCGEPQGYGIYGDHGSDVTVTGCCKIHDNEVGIATAGMYGVHAPSSTGGATLKANFSNIYDNEWFGVINYAAWGSTAPTQNGVSGLIAMDCKYNWWGHKAGPTLVDAVPQSPGAPTLNGGSQGDLVTLGIDFTPWLDGPCPSGKSAGPEAKFTPSSMRAKSGSGIQFKDISTPTPGCEVTEWSWTFGDGVTSTAQHPSHTYQRPGTYSVKLTIVDSCGNSASYSMSVTISSKGETVEPAKLGVSYLNIDPVQVLPNQEVVVSANICNSGGERGSKTVSLLLNGEAIDSQSVSVSAGGCQQVIFKTSRAVPGTYQVAVDGMAGQFSVLAPRTVTRNVPSQQQTGLGTAGIVAIIAIIVVLIVALVLVFRRD